MMLDQKMQVFLTVARLGSFSKASRRLSLGQTAVSFHINKLENELGSKLFTRNGRTISLTPEGDMLYQHGKKLALEAERLEKIFVTHSRTIDKRIRMAGNAYTCAFILPWRIAAFKKLEPDIVFSLEHMPEDMLVEKLLSGYLDIAMVGHLVRHRKLCSQRCFHDEIILIAPARNAPNRIDVEDLRQMPLLWATGDRGLELALNKSLSEAGLPMKNLNIPMELENLAVLKVFVEAGVGFAFLPRRTVENELRLNTIKEVKVNRIAPERMTYILYPKKEPHSKLIPQFVNFLNKLREQKKLALK